MKRYKKEINKLTQQNKLLKRILSEVNISNICYLCPYHFSNYSPFADLKEKELQCKETSENRECKQVAILYSYGIDINN